MELVGFVHILTRYLPIPGKAAAVETCEAFPGREEGDVTGLGGEPTSHSSVPLPPLVSAGAGLLNGVVEPWSDVSRRDATHSELETCQQE
jgi:hypothetical protein